MSSCQWEEDGVSGEGPKVLPPVKVALLLPYGSDQAENERLATSLENAAFLAVSDLRKKRIEVDLQVYETAALPSRAAQEAVKAVDDGAQIILGPVFAQETEAVGHAVAGRDINVLSFSNNEKIAGGNIFILGMTFYNAALRLSRYAVSRGKWRVMAVNEQTEIGLVALDAIRNATINANGEFLVAGSYEFSQEGVVEAAPLIAQTAKAFVPDILFLTADSAGALPLLSQLLIENGVGPEKIQMVGLTRWDIPQTTLSLPGVQNAWFALPDPELRAAYSLRYNAYYKEVPHPISGLAYDGIAAIGALIQQREQSFGRRALAQPAGFLGVNGVFRLMPDGRNERHLAIGKVSSGKVEIISPALKRFDHDTQL